MTEKQNARIKILQPVFDTPPEDKEAIVCGEDEDITGRFRSVSFASETF